MASISFRHFVVSTFTQHSRLKRWLMRLSIVGIMLGGGALAMGQADEWFASGLRTGCGYLLGFVIGAIVRIFFKLSLLVSAVVAAIAFGLSSVGLVDLPWETFGEVQSAFASEVSRLTGTLKEFLTSYLPAGVSSSIGLASGVTQKPDWTED